MNLDPLRRFGSRVARAAQRNPRRNVVGLIAIAAVATVALAVTMLGPARPASKPIAPEFTYARTWTLLELQRHVEAGEVVAVTVPTATDGTPSSTASSLIARTVDGQLVRVSLAVTPAEAVAALNGFGYGQLLTSEALSAMRPAAMGGASDVLRAVVGWIIPAVLIGLFIVLLVRLLTRGGTGEGGFSVPMVGRKRDEKTAAVQPGAPPAVRLDDVAGVDEAKLELTETIEFLQAPERFHQLGARIPRGIMLYGPPGTGKTMLARAVAAEAGVPFHHASGSDFVEKYVGVGAKRVRDLFAQARKLGRGVIFFDEFDAIGKARGGQNSHEEREQTLNQLLVELDGFSTTDDIVVIAATNRLDVLDAAVLRPGRFNRKIHVGLPDVVGRREILAVHARNKPIADPDVLEDIARKTYGFCGAQLADLLNEAAILAARRGGTEITSDDLHGGWLKVAVGTSRRRSMDERERSIIAAHEVGHAICGKVHGDKRRVEEICIFAHGEALGVTVSSQEDNDLPSESDLRARLIALMGGRAAEELLFHEVTGGASNDFEKANQIATTMVTKWGMGRDPEAKDAGTSGRGPLAFLVVRPNGSLPSEVQASATRAIRAAPRRGLRRGVPDAPRPHGHAAPDRRLPRRARAHRRRHVRRAVRGLASGHHRRRRVAARERPAARVARDPGLRRASGATAARPAARRHPRAGGAVSAAAASRRFRVPSPLPLERAARPQAVPARRTTRRPRSR